MLWYMLYYLDRTEIIRIDQTYPNIIVIIIK